MCVMVFDALQSIDAATTSRRRLINRWSVEEGDFTCSGSCEKRTKDGASAASIDEGSCIRVSCCALKHAVIPLVHNAPGLRYTLLNSHANRAKLEAEETSAS